MKKPINPYKPIVDRKFIIEQAENNNMSVWEFLKGFAEIDQLDIQRLYPKINNMYGKDEKND